MDETVSNLVSMGFDESLVKQALNVCGGNADRAVDMLLSGNVPTTAAAASSSSTSSSSSEMINCPISQYSVENGRSACTCIALTGAAQILQNESLSPSFLQLMIRKGVETYQRLARSANIEHMSAEEVLLQNAPELPVTLAPGGVRQGLLSSDPHHPVGLFSLLQALQHESSSSKVVLITKTPETVVVDLERFALLDSHPRPQLQADGAYAKTHTSLQDLVRTLTQSVFPHADLGPDVPEMMAMMYNSFDLYPLQLRG